MGKMKVPEPSAASPSFLSLPGQGGGEYSVGLKANLIRSRTQGPEECCSPLPSLPGELPGNSHWFCQRRFRFCVSVSRCFSVLFKRRVDWQQLCLQIFKGPHFLPPLEPMGELWSTLSVMLGTL